MSSSQEPSPPPLPDLCQAVLSAEDLQALARDLQALTQIVRIVPKYAAQAYAPETADLDLANGINLLQTGAIKGLQIHYLHEGSAWLDTLLSTPVGIRLVRMEVNEKNLN